MPIEFPSLTGLKQEEVTAARALLVQRLQEKAPTADFRRGVIHDLVLHLESVVHAAQETYADKFRKSGSILAIEADPSLADSALVDEVLSNFLITRKSGTKSYGVVTLTLSSKQPTIVPSGAVLSHFGKDFVITDTFSARLSTAAVATRLDRIIYDIGIGSYGFNIDVEAKEAGDGYALKQGDTLSVGGLSGTIASAFVSSDFTQGAPVENNLQLIERLKEGVTSKNFSNRHSVSSLVKGAFVGVKDVASFGYGAPEQIRYHGLFPVAHGGRVDVYIRNRGIPSKTIITEEATLAEQRLTGGLWQVSFTRDVAPGFYEASRVVRKIDLNNLSIVNGYEVIKVIRGFNIGLDGTGFSPDIENPLEASFTPYQTTTIQLLDTDTDAGLPLGTKADYSFTLRHQKDLRPIQNLLNGQDVRPTGSDALVRAVVPFDVRISIVVHNRNKDYVVPLDTIKSNLYDYVNGLGLSSELYESNVIAIVQNLITNDQSIASVDFRGRILYPSGRIRFINGKISLPVPNDPTNLVTPNTTAYFLDKSDIQITVKSV